MNKTENFSQQQGYTCNEEHSTYIQRNQKIYDPKLLNIEGKQKGKTFSNCQEYLSCVYILLFMFNCQKFCRLPEQHFCIKHATGNNNFLLKTPRWCIKHHKFGKG